MTNDIAPSLRRYSLLMLFIAGTLNMFDRQIINVLAQQIKIELNISDARLGLLTGTAFGLLYSFAIIPLARIADKTNRVKLIAIALTVWSGFTGLCGFANSFLQLFLARMGVGVGEAGCQPASVSLVADLFPPARRASATAILLVGAPVGACLGLMFGGYMSSNWGWRWALFAATIPGLAVAALMATTMRDPGPLDGFQPRDGNIAAALRLLGARRSLIWLTIAFGCETFCLHATSAWLPPFFIRAFGMSAVAAGGFLGLAVGAGGAVGAVVVGILCDRLRRADTSRDWLIAQLVLLANVPLVALVVFSPWQSFSLLMTLPLSMAVYGYLGPIPMLIQYQATPHTRALALGGVTAIANILSMCIGVPAVGALSDALHGRFGPVSVGYALAIMIGAAALFGAIALRQAERAARSIADFANDAT